MGERNTPEQNRAYLAARKERLRQLGFRQHTIEAHDEDWPEIKGLADRLKHKRLKQKPE